MEETPDIEYRILLILKQLKNENATGKPSNYLIKNTIPDGGSVLVTTTWAIAKLVSNASYCNNFDANVSLTHLAHQATTELTSYSR